MFSIKSALAYRDHVISRSKPQHVVLSFTHLHRSRGSFRLSWVLPEALRLLSEPGEDVEGQGEIFFGELAMPLGVCVCRRVRFSKANKKEIVENRRYLFQVVYMMHMIIKHYVLEFLLEKVASPSHLPFHAKPRCAWCWIVALGLVLPHVWVGLPERSVLAEVADGLFAELDFTMEERWFHNVLRLVLWWWRILQWIAWWIIASIDPTLGSQWFASIAEIVCINDWTREKVLKLRKIIKICQKRSACKSWIYSDIRYV